MQFHTTSSAMTEEFLHLLILQEFVHRGLNNPCEQTLA